MNHGMRLRESRHHPDMRQPNPESRLWKTCFHEAAHYVVSGDMGFEPAWPNVISPVQGVVHDTMPRVPPVSMRSLARRDILRRDAIIFLAGPAASHLLESFTPGCESDVKAAQRRVREIGGAYSYDDLLNAARVHVIRERTRITRITDRLAVQYVARRTA